MTTATVGMPSIAWVEIVDACFRPDAVDSMVALASRGLVNIEPASGGPVCWMPAVTGNRRELRSSGGLLWASGGAGHRLHPQPNSA